MSPAGRTFAVLALALVAALTGCTASTGTETPETSLPAGVAVELAQLRSDVAARQAQVRFVNDTDEVLMVGEVRVEDPRFDGAATRAISRETTVRPGGTVDVRVQLPVVACPAPDAAASTLAVHYRLGDDAREATVALPERIPFVAALHERECLVAALAEAATLSFGSFAPSPPGESAALRLEIEPTGAGGAELVGIRATNLLMFEGGAKSWPLGISLPGERQTVAVPLVPLRCDAHAVQEDKRGTVFTVDVVLHGEAGRIELAASPELRGEILRWVADWCGFAAP